MSSSNDEQSTLLEEPLPKLEATVKRQDKIAPPRSNELNSKSSRGSGRAKKAQSSRSSKANAKPRPQPDGNAARRRGRKPYPVVPFADVLQLAEGIMTHNGGQRANRVTLLGLMGKEPNSDATRNLVINSAKYGLTEGGKESETLGLTPKGLVAVNPKANPIEQRQARFDLAIGENKEFRALFDKRKGNNMPAPQMLQEDLIELDAGDRKPCADVFISNVKFLGMLVEREGAEYLMALEEWLGRRVPNASANISLASAALGDAQITAPSVSAIDYENMCFIISTINTPDSNERKHADVFMNQYVERTLSEFGLRIQRADKIGDPGMISRQIIEHIIHAKLVVADLSFHNPNVFYELSLRHATGRPTVHLIQNSDSIPFDLGNFRTIKIDTEDKYKMITELDTKRSEIATAIRQALANGESRDNPILAYFPTGRFVVNSPD